jgi:hypothetical protein
VSHWTEVLSILWNVAATKISTITGGRILEDKLANFNFENNQPKLR